ALGPAIGGGPLMGIGDADVIGLLHEAGLVFLGQQRQDCRNLVDMGVNPLAAAIVLPGVVPIGLHIAPIAAAPFGHGRLGVDGRAAIGRGFGQKRLIMLLGRLERIGADDGFAGIVAVAETPGRLGGV